MWPFLNGIQEVESSILSRSTKFPNKIASFTPRGKVKKPRGTPVGLVFDPPWHNTGMNRPLEGRWVDTQIAVEVGVQQDIGWGTVVLNEDSTVTRTCKGCGASVTSRGRRAGHHMWVESKPFKHEDNCPMWPFLSQVKRG